MACEVEGGSTGNPILDLFGGVVSDWVGLFLNVALAYMMLEAQEEAEEELEKIANQALSSAEELAAAYMQLRAYDQRVYDFMWSQPTYTPCNRDTHAIQAKRQATEFIKKSMGVLSRFDCGNKRRVLANAARQFMIGTMAEQETQDHFEKELEDAYLENRYDAIVSVATGSPPNSLAGSFGASAAIWAQQYQNASIQASGAIAGVGYFASSAFSGLFN